MEYRKFTCTSRLESRISICRHTTFLLPFKAIPATSNLLITKFSNKIFVLPLPWIPWWETCPKQPFCIIQFLADWIIGPKFDGPWLGIKGVDANSIIAQNRCFNKNSLEHWIVKPFKSNLIFCSWITKIAKKPKP